MGDRQTTVGASRGTRELECPRCARRLKEVTYKGVRIEECESCEGRWFHAHELKLAKDATDEELKWLDFDLFGEEARKYQTSSGRLECPNCSYGMTSLTYMDSKVIIDRCDECRGVWLDKQEFEKIIEYLRALVLAKPASEYAREALNDIWEIITKPEENRASEIKDFLAVIRLLELRLAAEHPWMMDLSRTWPIK